MIDEITKENADRLGNTGDITGNVLVTLIGAVDALEVQINGLRVYVESIKQCICEEPKKISIPTKNTKRSK